MVVQWSEFTFASLNVTAADTIYGDGRGAPVEADLLDVAKLGAVFVELATRCERQLYDWLPAGAVVPETRSIDGLQAAVDAGVPYQWNVEVTEGGSDSGQLTSYLRILRKCLDARLTTSELLQELTNLRGTRGSVHANHSQSASSTSAGAASGTSSSQAHDSVRIAWCTSDDRLLG